VVKDPGETTNIIAQHPTVAAALRAQLQQWTQSCRKSHAGDDYDTPFTPVDPFPEITGTWNQ